MIGECSRQHGLPRSGDTVFQNDNGSSIADGFIQVQLVPFLNIGIVVLNQRKNAIDLLLGQYDLRKCRRRTLDVKGAVHHVGVRVLADPTYDALGQLQFHFQNGGTVFHVSSQLDQVVAKQGRIHAEVLPGLHLFPQRPGAQNLQ